MLGTCMTWRLISNIKGSVADLYALPAAVATVRLLARYIPFLRPSAETIIIQRVAKRGVLAGADIVVDRDRAKKEKIQIAVLPKRGTRGPRPAETIALDELMSRASDRFTAVDALPDETSALIYTSGTAANPKGTILSHANFLAQCEATSPILPAGQEERFASLVPFFHIYGLAAGLIIPLVRGSSTVLIPQYAPRQFLRRLVEDRISVVMAIPTQYHHLLLAAKRSPIACQTLKACVSGAAPLPTKVIHAFKNTFGVGIMEGYGLTETTAAVTVNPPDATKPGSVGVPIKGVQIKIADDRGQAVDPHTPGEILVKGDIVTHGYYNLPQETEEAFVDGWFRTGDIGHQDEQGYLFITDRKKDLIVKGGFNVSPGEIEMILCTHPKVREAAVVGYKEKEGREEAIKACIVPVEDVHVTPREIINFCRMRLASYKIPDGIELRESLPKTVTGKVLRKALRPGYKDLSTIEKE